MNFCHPLQENISSFRGLLPRRPPGARGTDHVPPFSNFLFTNLFSIKFLYFFNISSLFPYFNLFVSIFIQIIVVFSDTGLTHSYADLELHNVIFLLNDNICKLNKSYSKACHSQQTWNIIFHSIILNNLTVNLIYLPQEDILKIYAKLTRQYPASKIIELLPSIRRTFQQYFSQQNALWERSHVDNSFPYIFIYRFPYLLTHYY
jgi:hypothetical protein